MKLTSKQCYFLIFLAFCSWTKVEAEECVGGWYIAKKNGTPLYRSADETSRVLTRLSRGDKLCYLGERQGFIMVVWSSVVISQRAHTDDKVAAGSVKYETPSADKPQPVNTEPDFAFARKFDLRTVAASSKRDFLSRSLEFVNYLRSGGIPDDGLAPFSPIISPIREVLNSGKAIELKPDEQFGRDTVEPDAEKADCDGKQRSNILNSQ